MIVLSRFSLCFIFQMFYRPTCRFSEGFFLFFLLLGRALFFLCLFYFFPPPGHFFGQYSTRLIRKYVGMPADHLFPDPPHHVLNGKQPLFFCDLSKKDDLKKYIPKLLAEIGGIPCFTVKVDPCQCFCHLIDHAWL